jgi:hypothetical protein
MKIKTDSSNRVRINTNKPVGAYGYMSQWLTVYGKKNPHVLINKEKYFLTEKEQVEDYIVPVPFSDDISYTTSQFSFKV